MIYLASKSPRRSDLLNQIGINHQVVNIEIDETPRQQETPTDYVLRMAKEKALQACSDEMTIPLLAADTSVICEEKILGKPENKEQFLEMFELLNDNQHQVITAVAVIKDTIQTSLSVSQVSFRKITPEEALLYWETGEPRDKAGGYGIQGKAAIFINDIHGSYSGIMGLPLYETSELLAEFGVYSQYNKS